MHATDGQPKLGMNMLLWSTDVTGPEYDADVRTMLRTLGYDGVEIPIFDREVDKYARARRAARRTRRSRRSASAPAPRTTARSAHDPEVRARGLAATRRPRLVRRSRRAAPSAARSRRRSASSAAPVRPRGEARVGREPARARAICQRPRRDDRHRVPEPLRDVSRELPPRTPPPSCATSTIPIAG